MQRLLEFIEQGGVVLIALMVLSVLLYERCFNLLLLLRRWKRHIAQFAGTSRISPTEQDWLQEQLAQRYHQCMAPIRTLVPAAPLMGLLGTVIGMIGTFSSLTTRAGARSIEGLADGISLALITTETGLSIAIPALILVTLTEREFKRRTREIADLDSAETSAERRA